MTHPRQHSMLMNGWAGSRQCSVAIFLAASVGVGALRSFGTVHYRGATEAPQMQHLYRTDAYPSHIRA